MELREKGEPLKAGEKEVGGVYQWRGGGWSLYSNREGCEWSLAIKRGVGGASIAIERGGWSLAMERSGWSLYSNREGCEWSLAMERVVGGAYQ